MGKALKEKLSLMARQKSWYLMLMPAFLVTLIFLYVPLYGWIMAFTNYKVGFSIFKGKWAGLEHFKAFLVDANDGLLVLRNTVSINIIYLVVSMVLACGLAILVNEVKTKWIRSIVQTCSFFPFFISTAVVYIIFYTFLSVQDGLINTMLVRLKITDRGIDFLGNPGYAWPLIIFVTLWRYTGYNMVLFLAAIMNISPELYQVADIDGAGRFQKIWYITLPSLAPMVTILLIINAGNLFSSDFSQYFLFSNPTNRSYMEVFDVYIYRYGLKLFNFSYATAAGIVKTAASVLTLLFVNSLSKKISQRSIF